jgi:hypothetical protein
LLRSSEVYYITQNEETIKEKCRCIPCFCFACCLEEKDGNNNTFTLKVFCSGLGFLTFFLGGFGPPPATCTQESYLKPLSCLNYIFFGIPFLAVYKSMIEGTEGNDIVRNLRPVIHIFSSGWA